MKSIMPFRLDVALWGTCLFLTVARRIGIAFKTDSKYFFMKYGER